MNIKDLFKKKKQANNQDYITVKYSKMDHLGHPIRIPIIQQQTIENIQTELATLKQTNEQLKEKLDRIPDKLIDQLTKHYSGWVYSTVEVLKTTGQDYSGSKPVTIDNRKYMSVRFYNYRNDKTINVRNLKTMGCKNLVRITLLRIVGGGTSTVGTYRIPVNIVCYQNVIESNSSSKNITFELPELQWENLRVLNYWYDRNRPVPEHMEYFEKSEMHFKVEVISSI